jgi:protein TonB
MNAPPFLAALGLDAEAAARADERSIRRAYAKRLKQIDIEADPAAFQALRETLEQALRWAAWQQRQAQEDTAVEEAAPAPGSPAADQPPATPAPDEQAAEKLPIDAPAPPPEPAAPTIESQADEVFVELARGLREGLDDEAGAAGLLKNALADERLVNLDARAFFEWRVACMLVNGWVPGLQFVFRPACDAFHWETDRRRLGVYGQVGATIDAAIRERLVFFGLPSAEFETLRLLIVELRADGPVTRAVLVRDMPYLQLLVQRYPNWLGIVTSRANIHARLEQWKALPAEQRPAPPASPLSLPIAPKPPPRRTLGPAGIVMMGLFALFHLMSEGWAPSHRVNPAQAPATAARTLAESALPARQREAEAALQRALVAARAASGSAASARAPARVALDPRFDPLRNGGIAAPAGPAR